MEEYLLLKETLRNNDWKVTPLDGQSLINGLLLIKGNIRIWQVRRGWQIAELINGKYCNHRTEQTLEIAIDKNS